ncbi:MAG: ABC transporter permease [Planctomycetes bacterium]|nr:ABC transporter permease [Planctomycetota bacterium]
MSKILTVAWREFTQTVMRKIFIIAVLGMPVVIIGIMVVAIFLMEGNKQPPLVGTVAIVDASGDVAIAAKVEFEAARIRSEAQQKLQDQAEKMIEGVKSGNLSSMPTTPSQADNLALRGKVDITIESVSADTGEQLEALQQRIRDGNLLAVAVIQPELLQPPVSAASEEKEEEELKYSFYVSEDFDSDHASLIRQRLGKSIVRVRAQRAGYEPEQVMAIIKSPSADTKRILAEGGIADETKGDRALRKMIPMVFMMLIWIGVFTSAQHLLMTTIEEKSNRVMEVLLSAVSPFQLMAGKILGHGGVGLLIVSIYGSVIFAALIAFSFFHLIDPMDIVYLVVFYLMAYFMIASMMAAVGSAVSDIREANTLVTPMMLILMVPLMLWPVIIEAPNGPIATWCSFIPLAAPFAMILRLAAEEPIPIWQIPVSIVWGYICVFGMVWGASKIFRVGVLMYGKPPSPLELIKWMRYS